MKSAKIQSTAAVSAEKANADIAATAAVITASAFIMSPAENVTHDNRNLVNIY